MITPNVTTEQRAKLPGARIGSLPRPGFTGGRLYYHSREIAAEGNRWSGANRTGYQNVSVDAILDRMAITIDPAQRVTLHRNLLSTMMGDVALIPLHIGVGANLYNDSVTGIVDQLPYRNWHFNIHEWQKR